MYNTPPEDLDRTQLAHTLERVAQKLEAKQSTHWTDNKSLCTSCRWATVTRRHSQNERRIRCVELQMWVPTDIVECNSYGSLTELSLSQMSEMAILIETRTKAVGFYSH